MRTMIRSVLVSVLLGFLTVVAAQRTPSCEEWNRITYFQTATVKDVTACLDAGADLEAQDILGETPLHKAAENNKNPAVTQALIDAGADLKVRDNGGFTPLHGAATWNNENPAVLKALLAAGADPMARDDDGNTPLHLAARYENSAVIQALIDAGADLKVRNENGNTPLHLAARYSDNSAVVQVLLAAGAELEVRDEDGFTPLHLAAMNENPAVIQALIDAGADLKVRDKWGLTPLHRAARDNENPAVVQILLAAEAGAELEVRDKWGLTPLNLAAGYNENPAVSKALLAAGADLKVRDEDGNTPLNRAARYNDNSAVVQVLLAAGAELEVRDKDGNTPLHWAAKYVHLYFPDHVKHLGDDDPHAGGTIEALLDAGADPMAPNAAGETPWDLAKGNKALKGSDAYWRLNEARFEAPGRGARGSPTTGPTSTSDKSNVELAAAVPSSGPGCEIPGYPSPPGGVANLGFSWCPASVTLQVRSFALQAAGAQCAIATGSSSTSEQIQARRREIKEACDRLAALGARLDGPNSGASCRCPAGFGP